LLVTIKLHLAGGEQSADVAGHCKDPAQQQHSQGQLTVQLLEEAA
jgi:hypothetical protein